MPVSLVWSAEPSNWYRPVEGQHAAVTRQVGIWIFQCRECMATRLEWRSVTPAQLFGSAGSGCG